TAVIGIGPPFVLDYNRGHRGLQTTQRNYPLCPLSPFVTFSQKLTFTPKRATRGASSVVMLPAVAVFSRSCPWSTTLLLNLLNRSALSVSRRAPLPRRIALSTCRSSW